MSSTNIKTLPIFTWPEIIRFWSLIDKRGPDECWPWLGKTSTARYGAVYGVWYCRGRWKPHRVAWELHHDNRQAKHPIPEGMTIDHVKAKGCTMTLCCNYNHLEPVTQSVNVGRYWAVTSAQRDFCKCGQPRLPNGRDRRCQNCRNAYFREYNARNHEKVRSIAKASYDRKGRDRKKQRYWEQKECDRLTYLHVGAWSDERALRNLIGAYPAYVLDPR